METDTEKNIQLILKIQEKAKKEVLLGDLEMAKILLLKAKELLSLVNKTV